MSFNKGKQIGNITVFDLSPEKIGLEYPLPEDDRDDKCNLHMLNNWNKEQKAPKKKERVKKALEPGQQMGHWTVLQKKKYHWFLQMHHGHFQNKHLRRTDKIFKAMSTFIGTRAAQQCRSHHQKMQKKYRSFYHIIYNLRLLHYNCLQIQQMIQQFTSYGIKSPNSLIYPFPQLPIIDMKTQTENMKLQQRLNQNIHYNFFCQQQDQFIDRQFLDMNS